MKNCVLTCRLNFKENDMKSCKVFAMQACAVNYPCLVMTCLNREVIETLVCIDVDVRTMKGEFNPLVQFMKTSNGCRQHPKLRVLRLKGNICE